MRKMRRRDAPCEMSPTTAKIDDPRGVGSDRQTPRQAATSRAEIHRPYRVSRAPQRLSRPRRRRLAPRRRRPDQGRPRARQRRARPAQHVRRGDRQGRRSTARQVAKQRLAHLLLHKPAGVVTTARDPQGRPTVVELVPNEPRVVPVGRLDADTTGALLLTNDGPLAHRLAHPRYGIEKVYEAEVGGRPARTILRSLREGVELDDGITAPAQVRRLGPHTIELDDPRGAKPPGQADVRGGRPPGAPPAPQCLRGTDARRARARPVARARALRSRCVYEAASPAARRSSSRTCARPLVIWPWFGIVPGRRGRQRVLHLLCCRVPVVCQLQERLLLGRVGGVVELDPEASAFESAISVSVANCPTLELIWS